MNQIHLRIGLVVASVAAAFACDRGGKGPPQDVGATAAQRLQVADSPGNGVPVQALTVAAGAYAYRVVGQGALDSYHGSAQTLTASFDGTTLQVTRALDGTVQESSSVVTTSALRATSEVPSEAIGLFLRPYRALPDAPHADGAWGPPPLPPDEAAANQAFGGIVETGDADYVATDAMPSGGGSLVRVKATHYTKIVPNDFANAITATRVAGGLDAFPTGRQEVAGASVTDLYVDANGRGVVLRALYSVDGSDTSYLTCLTSASGVSAPSASFAAPATATPARFSECAL